MQNFRAFLSITENQTFRQCMHFVIFSLSALNYFRVVFLPHLPLPQILAMSLVLLYTLRLQTVNIHCERDPKKGMVNNQIIDWSFKLDGIMHNASQEAVFSTTAADVVTAALDGYNGRTSESKDKPKRLLM